MEISWAEIVVVLGLLGLLMIAGAAVLRSRAAAAARLAAVERQLSAITAHVGVPAPEVETADVEAKLAEGRTAEAVRLYRRRTGAGLAEAKQAVDDIARRAR